ncbi:MAG: Rieske (2Fe-2S) protein [Bacteroidota bacterium]
MKFVCMPEVTIFQDLSEAHRTIPVGEKRLVRIGSKRICLIHFAEGFRAVADECPHMSYSLTKGTINHLGEIVCPWQAYRFHTKTGEEAERRCGQLRMYQLMEQDGLKIVVDD